MHRFLFVVCLALVGFCRLPAQSGLSFDGTDHRVVTDKPEASTGLDMIYTLYSTAGVSAVYTPASDNVTWYKYSNLGGAFAEEVTPIRLDDGRYSLSMSPSDMGYIISDGTTRHYYWVVNYENHRASLRGIIPATDQECDRARLRIDGDLAPITYYTINGQSRQLSRDVKLSYHSLEYDADTEAYRQVERSQIFAAVDGTIGVAAPLCDTYFRATADRFLQTWDMGIAVESALYPAIAVEAETSATQALRENENEQSVEANLGGSAPVEITFKAAVTDAAIFREWQISRDQEFELIDDRFQQDILEYTFRDSGTSYVRFVCANADGSCEYVGETYDVFVGESALMCPNAFSPNDDGVNDLWCVSYKSLVSFECSIFNRWGQKMISFTDPARGWDGKYGGKTVPTGVYYYVIKAVGSDGRKYNLSGDINVVRKKINPEIPSDE